MDRAGHRIHQCDPGLPPIPDDLCTVGEWGGQRIRGGFGRKVEDPERRTVMRHHARDRRGSHERGDARDARPADRDGLLHEATRDRLPPGEGAIDLVALLRAMPRGIPVALEVPMEEAARREPAPARLARLVAATRAVLARAYS